MLSEVDVMDSLKPIIGLEVHVTLNTKSKLFCQCSIGKTSKPNTSVCEICLGFPGAKPFINKQAVLMALKTAIGLNCQINNPVFFSRKTYFYPDLAKNYQITQYEKPVGVNGFLKLSGQKIKISRVQLEEDPGAIVYEQGLTESQFSLIDYNRSGIPLIEIVTEPVISSPSQAQDFLKILAINLEYLEVFEPFEAILKVDANISLQGHQRVEIKNILGFKEVEQALDSEIKRQQKMILSKTQIERETRGFDQKTGMTFSLRKKETEQDYGYIFDPDLPIIQFDNKTVNSMKKSMPELFEEKKTRFQEKLGLKEFDARVIASIPALSILFEQTIKKADIKTSAGFFSRELLAIINYNNLSLKKANLSWQAIAELIELLQKGQVSEKNAKQAMIKYALEKILPKQFLLQSNLLLDLKQENMEKTVNQVVAENAMAIKDFKAGNKKALNFLVGLVMKKTKGKTQPRQVQKLIQEKIENK